MTQFHESSDEIQHQIALNLNQIIIVILFYRYYIKMKAFDLDSWQLMYVKMRCTPAGKITDIAPMRCPLGL